MSDFKIYYEATMIKTVWCGIKINIYQQKKQNAERDPINGQLTWTKNPIHQGKDSIFNRGCQMN